MRVHYTRVRALGRWIAEGKTVWLSILPLPIAVLLMLLFSADEPGIRLYGLVLQLAGIGTVIVGIEKTRKRFGQSPFGSKVVGWLGKFPGRQRNVLTPCTGGVIAGGGKARIVQTHGPGENPTTEARLIALEKNINEIHNRISKTQDEIDEEFRNVYGKLNQEAQTRKCKDATILDKLEATGTGGVHIALIGASWLFLGVILGTAAPELSCLVGASHGCWFQ